MLCVFAAFLSVLCIFESWLPELPPPSGDFIALHCLLFLSQTYGGVLPLIVPLIAVETVIRLLWPRADVHRGTARQKAASDGRSCDAEEQGEEDGSSSDQDRLSHVVGYLCCLSVWVIVALGVRWQWELEEVWAAACLHTTGSLVRCLPNLFGPVNLCWTFLFLLLLLTTTGLQRRRRAHVQTPTVSDTGHRGSQDLVAESPAPLKPVKAGLSVCEPAQHVDPEKTESSCTLHTAGTSWHVSACNHGDFVLIFPTCLSGKRGGPEEERPRRAIPLTFITGEHVDSQHRTQCGWRLWGFPRLGVNVIIGLLCALSIFSLPLNLSVNILLIRTIETLLELFIKSVLSSAANAGNTPTCGAETLI